jgi:hypothetical protein
MNFGQGWKTVLNLFAGTRYKGANVERQY